MLHPEEKAMFLFNRAIKQAIVLNVEPNKENAKFLALSEIQAAKEFLYDSTLIDSLAVNQLKKTFEYIDKIKQVIEKL